MNSEQSERIEYLFFRYCDGSISSEEMDALNSAMQKSQYVRNKYFDFMKTDLALSHFVEQNLHKDLSPKYSLEDLTVMAEYEKTAPAIEIPKDEPQRELISKVVYKKTPRRLRKTSVFSLLVSAAAVLFVILFVKFVPSKQYSVEAATLVDQMNTKWATKDVSLQNGSALKTLEDSKHLLQGYVRLRFLDGAEVVIEGPSEFNLKSPNSMYMDYGRLYAKVPSRASGFSVNTPSCNIVDLGTEFGVKAGFDGTSDLTVVRGKTLISADINNAVSAPIEIAKGQAIRVSTSEGQVYNIEPEDRMFVRDFSSKTGVVWRGEPINLANLASGGDGFSKPGTTESIDPRTGLGSEEIEGDRNTTNNYVVVEWNPYVDGVFVPNGKTAQTVTSAGHQFLDCPPTNGVFFSNIVVYQHRSSPVIGMTLNGQQYGFSDKPAIFLHANAGITYDLARIRELCPNGNLVFRSKIGMSEEAPREGNADFWVLVDGVVRYEKRGVYKKGVISDEIEIKLNQTDRFLTLMTTDAGDEEWIRKTEGRNRRMLSTDADWCIFAEPFISTD